MIYKLVVISDVHHDTDRLATILPIINQSNYLIFCGDGMDSVMRMRGSILVPMVCVRGNNDRYSTSVAEMASIVLGNTRVMVTHGHKHGVRQGLDGIVSAARFKGCSLAFYGHTHRFFDGSANGIHLICPGALCEGSYAAVVGDGVNFTCKQQFVQ